MFNKVQHTYLNHTHIVLLETAVAHDNNNNYHLKNYVESNSWSIHFAVVCVLLSVYYLIYFLEKKYSETQWSFPKIKADSNLADLNNIINSLVSPNVKLLVTQNKIQLQTRMHSSRMCTAHSLTVSHSIWLGGGACVPCMPPSAMHAPHHTCPPATHAPMPCMCTAPPCMPPTTNTPCHACPLATHTPL